MEAMVAMYRYRPRTVLGSYVIARGMRSGNTATSIPWGVDIELLMEIAPKIILVQPKIQCHPRWISKAKSLGKINTGRNISDVWVYVNKFPRPITKKDANLTVKYKGMTANIYTPNLESTDEEIWKGMIGALKGAIK
jgi:hypothetical protein